MIRMNKMSTKDDSLVPGDTNYDKPATQLLESIHWIEHISKMNLKSLSGDMIKWWHCMIIFIDEHLNILKK